MVVLRFIQKILEKIQVFVDASLQQVAAYADQKVYACNVVENVKNITSATVA